MYQITEAHGIGIEVTSAAVDPTGTRMASGGYDGKFRQCVSSSKVLFRSLYSYPVTRFGERLFLLQDP